MNERADYSIIVRPTKSFLWCDDPFSLLIDILPGVFFSPILIQALKSLALYNNKMEKKNISPKIYPNVVATSSRNPGRTATPFAHKGLKKSLEEIVSNSTSKQKESPLENMFADKAKTLKASVNALLEEITLRDELNAHQFKKIDDEICRQHTQMMQLENLVDHHPFDLTKGIDEARAQIETNVLELEREKRSEGLECWRDLMFLKKYLMVSLKDYWELARKRGVLGS
ncbi:MAG: hypothetical protein ABIJ59_12370 [Pseudomonadota bacterium]